MVTKQRVIVYPDFYEPGVHLYEDMLGFTPENKEEARSVNDREVFRYHICEVGLEMVFYYLETKKFYSISTMATPIKIKELKMYPERSPYPYWQCNRDQDEDATVLATFENPEDIWDNLFIEGKRIPEVLRSSFIVALV